MTTRTMAEVLSLGALVLGAVAQGLAFTGRVLPAAIAAVNGLAVAVVALGYRMAARPTSPSTRDPRNSIQTVLSADQAVRMPVPPWREHP